MGIVERVSTLLRANINELIDRSEDPEKMVKQILLDLNSNLIQVKTQVAASIADQKHLYQRYQENQRKADDWQNKAELAVAKGDDELARTALTRKNAYQQTADGFREQHEEQSRQVEVLKDALRALENKVSEAQARKDLLIARSRRAKAETRIRSTLAGIDSSGALAGLERIEDKVRLEEARASALAELDSDSVEQRISILETESEVERQLAEIKARKALGPGKADGE